MQKKETKKDALINLSLLLFMKNNTKDKNLDKFIESFDNE